MASKEEHLALVYYLIDAHAEIAFLSSLLCCNARLKHQTEQIVSVVMAGRR
jgi:hypothetical protein